MAENTFGNGEAPPSRPMLRPFSGQSSARGQLRPPGEGGRLPLRIPLAATPIPRAAASLATAELTAVDAERPDEAPRPPVGLAEAPEPATDVEAHGIAGPAAEEGIDAAPTPTPQPSALDTGSLVDRAEPSARPSAGESSPPPPALFWGNEEEIVSPASGWLPTHEHDETEAELIAEEGAAYLALEAPLPPAAECAPAEECIDTPDTRDTDENVPGGPLAVNPWVQHSEPTVDGDVESPVAPLPESVAGLVSALEPCTEHAPEMQGFSVAEAMTSEEGRAPSGIQDLVTDGEGGEDDSVERVGPGEDEYLRAIAGWDSSCPQGASGAESLESRSMHVDTPASEPDAPRGAGMRAAEMLEGIAHRVRCGEIVVAADEGASPESVLANVLASLLTTRS